MNIDNTKIRNYLYVFILLALSGNPFFKYNEGLGSSLFVAFIFYLFLKHFSLFDPRIKKNKHIYIFLFFYSIVFAIQYFVLGLISFPASIKVLLMLMLGYVIVRVVNLKFRNVYFDIIYFISLVSLFGYVLNISGITIPNIANDESVKNILLYTQRNDDLRNSGMFWEPGAFACYICLAFLFSLGKIRLLFNSERKKFIIILIALITTFSTTGYLVAFFIFGFTILVEFGKKYRGFVIPILLLFLLGGIYVYESTDFLKEKLEHQYSNSITNQVGEYAPDRLGAFLFDWHYIRKHPLTGNGFDKATRLADHPYLWKDSLGLGNGLSNYVACMGIISLLFFLLFIVKNNIQYPWIFLIGILLLLQGEQLMNFPLFLSLPFLFIYEKRNSRFANLFQQKAKNLSLS